MTRVRKTELSQNSQLNKFFSPGDFLDCYTVRIGPGEPPIEKIAQDIFVDLPWWVNMLLAIRDFGVSLFGLKTTAKLSANNTLKSSLRVGEPVNFFCVRAIYDHEVILGEDDKHLDFKISVSRAGPNSPDISLATLVRTHNWFGRLYLRMITPFHILIVSSSLKALSARDYSGETT